MVWRSRVQRRVDRDFAIEALRAACAARGVGVRDILAYDRHAPLVAKRDGIIHAVAGATGWGPAALGRLFHRHHATIIHSLRKRD